MADTTTYEARISLIAIIISLFITSAAPARTLTWETTLDAPVEDVWDAFTTEAGIESWMVPHATIDLRIGGTIRTSYEAEPTPGHPSTIVHRILSYEPMRMLSTRVERSPEGFEHAWVIERVWGVTRFTPIGPNRTHVHMASIGWGEGERWDAAERFFNEGNAWTLAQLEKKFADDADSAASAEKGTLDLLHRLVGGEWIHESERPDGSVFRVRNIVRHGPDGRSLVADGWLGTAEGMVYHGATQVWREPQTGRVLFQSLGENGSVSRGEITALGDDGVLWDWNMTDAGGNEARFHVEMRLIDQEHYRFVLGRCGEGGEIAPMVDIVYERVERAPARFRVMKKPDRAGAGAGEREAASG